MTYVTPTSKPYAASSSLPTWRRGDSKVDWAARFASIHRRDDLEKGPSDEDDEGRTMKEEREEKWREENELAEEEAGDKGVMRKYYKVRSSSFLLLEFLLLFELTRIPNSRSATRKSRARAGRGWPERGRTTVSAAGARITFDPDAQSVQAQKPAFFGGATNSFLHVCESCKRRPFVVVGNALLVVRRFVGSCPLKQSEC